MDSKLLRNTVQYIPHPEEANFGTLMITFANTASEIEPWGANWRKRDQQLRTFYKKEPFLKSTVFNIATTRASLTWELDGPPKTVSKIHNVLNNSDFGKGWTSLMMKVATDVLVSDNGAFIEIIRSTNSKNAPVVGLAHLSSENCTRTGNPMYPVIYTNANGKIFKLPYWRVITFEEFPSPEELQHDRQICFVSRVLEGARVIRDIQTYKEEKVSGRFAKAIHLVGGVAKHEIDNAQNAANIDADNAGLTRYIQPILLAALDPTARVSHEKIELASLPDHFDEDETMKWYITLLALASGGDFQDFAPLPGGNLGTASQSDTLHRKSRVKGIRLWMKLVEHKLQHNNIIPSSVSFKYTQEDAAAEQEKVELSHRRAQLRKLQIDSGEIDSEIARRIAVDAGDLKPEYMMMLQQEQPEAISATVTDDERVSEDLIGLEEGKITIKPKKIEFEEAVETANEVTKQIQYSKMNAVSPISPYKLVTFYQELIKEIQKENITDIYTTEEWICDSLTRCAFKSNILPIQIKHRLPDNYKVTILENKIINSENKTLFVKEVKEVKQKETIKCRVCEEEGYYTYIPFRGFTTTCDKHRSGIRCDKEIGSLIENFDKVFDEALYPADTYLTAIMCAYELGRNKKLNFGKVRDTLRKDVEEHVILLRNKKLLKNSIYKWYFKGLLTKD